MAKPNKKHRALQRKYEILMRAFEKPFANKIASEKNRYIQQFARNYTDGINDSAAALELHQSRIGQIIKAYADIIMPAFARFQTQLFKSPKVVLQTKDASNDLMKQAAQQYMVQYGYKKSKIIAETTRNDIRSILSKYADIPITEPELIKEIRGVSALSAARAAIIARTETHNASQYAVAEIGNFVESTLEVQMVKAWVSSEDERTRETHAEMDAGDFISIHDPFIVGGEELMFAGDPAGSAENVINCRCVTVYEEREFLG